MEIVRVLVPNQKAALTGLGVGGMTIVDPERSNPVGIADDERVVIETERQTQGDGKAILEYHVYTEKRGSA